MDGFESHNGMIILAATNRPEVLDPALLRAGRFDRQILVDRADLPGRKAILEIHAVETQLASDVQLEKVAALTPGFTGADLANLVNEATLLATRRDSESVSMEDFNAAIERIVAGLEKKNRLLNKTERRRVAFHELGHAFTAQALPGADPVHKVSIIPRGIGALGYTIQRPTEDRFLMSQRELENKIVVLLAGRAAEVLVFGVPGYHRSRTRGGSASAPAVLGHRRLVGLAGHPRVLSHWISQSDLRHFVLGVELRYVPAGCAHHHGD